VKKSLRDDMISALRGEDKINAALPDGYYAIVGQGGRYVEMPIGLTLEEWLQQQEGRGDSIDGGV